MSFDVTTAAGRRALRAALLDLAPWLADPVQGPSTVDAGMCERCARHPRVVTTCGPGPLARCLPCARAAGVDAWCNGHRKDAVRTLAWLDTLPEWWATAVTAWWVATGEVRPTTERVSLPGPSPTSRRRRRPAAALRGR